MTGFAFSAIRAGDYGIHIHLSFSFFVRIIGVFDSFRSFAGIASFLAYSSKKRHAGISSLHDAPNTHNERTEYRELTLARQNVEW